MTALYGVRTVLAAPGGGAERLPSARLGRARYDHVQYGTVLRYLPTRYLPKYLPALYPRPGNLRNIRVLHTPYLQLWMDRQ